MGGTVRLITNQRTCHSFNRAHRAFCRVPHGGGFNHKDSLMINLPLLDDNPGAAGVGTEKSYQRLDRRIVVKPVSIGRRKSGRHRARRRSERSIQNRYPGSNAYQTYAARVTWLWKPTD